MKTKNFCILLFILFASKSAFAQEDIYFNPSFFIYNPQFLENLSKAKDSIHTGYHKNGQLAWKYTFKNKALWNIEKYAENGTPIFFGTLKNGNGTLENPISVNDGKHVQRVIGNFLNGKPDGNWQIFSDAEGTILDRETLYRNGYVISSIQYDEKGRILRETIYNEKKLPKSIYDNKQEITDYKVYKKGKLIQETKTVYELHKRPKTTTTIY